MRYAAIYREVPARHRARRKSPIHTKAARHGVLVHVNGLQVNAAYPRRQCAPLPRPPGRGCCGQAIRPPAASRT